MAEAPHLDAQNPWPGLAAFTEADRAYFRGRDAEADELARLVRRERLTVLFGRSGLGKSSLLNAGLFPRLREDLHLPVVLRIAYGAALGPRRQVWDALAAACKAANVEAPLPEEGESMWAYFHRAGAGFWNRRRRGLLPVLVFDQFEEVFTLGLADDTSRASAEAFLDELADLVEDRPSEALRKALDADPARGEQLDFERRGCKLVLSFREDFLAEVEGLRRRMPSVMRNRYRLLPMGGEQARAVIASGGPLVAADVAERIVGLAWRNRAVAPLPEEADAIEIDPALLSVICSELNLRRRAAGAARIEATLLAGAETEILADFYERSLQGLDPGVRQFVEDELITTAGYRDSFAFDDALARPGVTREALTSLIAGRLLRVDERFGVRRVELTHDVLTRVVKDSRDARRSREAEAAALERERRAAQLARRNRRRALVSMAGLAAAALLLGWSVVKTQQADELKAEAQLQKDQADAARIDADAQRGNAQKLEAIAAALAASAARATGYAEQALREAASAAQAAAAQQARAAALERAAVATGMMVAARGAPPEQLALQLLLGAEAGSRYRDRLDVQVEHLARVLAAHRVRRLLHLDERIVASAAVGDGSRVLLGTADGRLTMVDAREGKELGRWQLVLGETRVQNLRLAASADGRLALVELNHEPQLVHLTPGQPLKAQRVGRYGGGPQTALSPDGRWLADGSGPNVIEIRALADGALTAAPRRVSLPLPGQPRCMSFTAQPGRLLVGTAQQSWSIDLADGSVERLPLRDGIIDFDAGCTRALGLDTAPDGDKSYVLLDVATGQPVRVLQYLRATQPRVLLGQPVFVDGGAFVAARFASGFELWPLAKSDVEAWAWSAAEMPRASSVSPTSSADGRWLALHLGGRRVELRRLAEPEFTARFELPEPPRALHFARDGSSLFAVGQGRLAQAVRLTHDALRFGDDRAFQAAQIEFSADGSHLGASANNFGDGLALWRAQDGQMLPFASKFSTIEFSPDGALAAAFNQRGDEVSLFDLHGGKVRPLPALPLRGDTHLDTLAIDHQARRVAYAVRGAVILRDLRDANWQRRIAVPDTGVDKLTFHPRGTLLAAVLKDGGLRVFGVPDGNERLSIAHDKARERERATAAAYSLDGRWLVVGRRDGAIVLRDAAGGGRPLTLNPPRDRTEAVSNLVFIQGTSIFSAGALDGGKDFWDLESRRWIGLVGPDPERERRGEPSDLRAVAISSHGRRVALRHADDTITLRGWDPDSLVRDACAIAGRNLSCDEWDRYVRLGAYRKTCPALPAPDPPCATPAMRR